MRGSVPQRYLVKRPTANSTYFGGRHINLSKIARDEGLDRSYLSLVLSGHREPSPRYVRHLSRILLMDKIAILRVLDKLQQYSLDITTS